MAKEGSVAPKERVNIVYKPATDGAEEVELPLKILAIGDYTGRADDRQLEDRKPINIDKDNFEEVMEKHDLALQMQVPGCDVRRRGRPRALGRPQVQVDEGLHPLKACLQQVPELQKLMDLRNALTALKSPLGQQARASARSWRRCSRDRRVAQQADEPSWAFQGRWRRLALRRALICPTHNDKH